MDSGPAESREASYDAPRMSTPNPDRAAPSSRPVRRRGRGIRPWLIAGKLTGVITCLGGLASLAAISIWGPTPESLDGWRVLHDVSRMIFFPCVFWGLVTTIVFGIALLAQHPRAFLGMRWFRVKAAALVVVLPSLHFFARGRVLEFNAAVERGATEELPERWAAVGTAYVIAVLIMLPLALFARIKPRLAQPVRPPRSGRAT